MIQNNPFRKSVDGKRSKKGVSPVIGVILMVAATIVIAAVVIAMLGGFAPPSKPYLVSVTAEQRVVEGTPRIYVTYQGGPDADALSCITGNITLAGIDTAVEIPVDGTVIPEGGFGDCTSTTPTVGASWHTTDTDTPGIGGGGADDHVVVTGKFLDGKSQVILDTWV
jgi:flagellin-like protein